MAPTTIYGTKHFTVVQNTSIDPNDSPPLTLYVRVWELGAGLWCHHHLLLRCATNHLRSYPNYERWTGAYNAGGQVEVQKRALRLTDPAILAEYGNGFYPLRWVYDKGEGGDTRRAWAPCQFRFHLPFVAMVLWEDG